MSCSVNCTVMNQIFGFTDKGKTFKKKKTLSVLKFLLLYLIQYHHNVKFRYLIKTLTAFENRISTFFDIKDQESTSVVE